MKLALLAALCLFTASFARAESGTAPLTPVAKVPAETVEVAPESSTGLFERVREAHIRALQKGSVIAAVRG